MLDGIGLGRSGIRFGFRGLRFGFERDFNGAFDGQRIRPTTVQRTDYGIRHTPTGALIHATEHLSFIAAGLPTGDFRIALRKSCDAVILWKLKNAARKKNAFTAATVKALGIAGWNQQNHCGNERGNSQSPPGGCSVGDDAQRSVYLVQIG